MAQDLAPLRKGESDLCRWLYRVAYSQYPLYEMAREELERVLAIAQDMERLEPT